MRIPEDSLKAGIVTDSAPVSDATARIPPAMMMEGGTLLPPQ